LLFGETVGASEIGGAVLLLLAAAMVLLRPKREELEGASRTRKNASTDSTPAA
jgi:hypothetical protein